MWVVIAVAPDGKLLMANWSSRKPKWTPGCELHIADHPKITHDSYMQYAKAQEFTLEQLREFIRNGNFTAERSLSPSVLCRVQQGLFSDAGTLPRFKTRYHYLRSS